MIDAKFEMLDVVIVESFASFPPKVTGTNHLPQQRRRSVFILAQLLMQPFQHSQQRIEAHEISKR